jgi:hypothetical protein
VCIRTATELERKYHVEDPRRKDNEIVYREVEMGCYEIESTPITSTKMELNSKSKSCKWVRWIRDVLTRGAVKAGKCRNYLWVPL